MKRNNILVTGGAGFIGSNLCKRLLQNPSNYVICLDNLFTGSKKNIAQFLDNPNFEFILQDVTQPFDFKVDQIYNLACPASPPFYQFNPISTWETSIFGAINVTKLALKYKARVLQASTSEVYGDALEHPQKETYWGNVNPIGIRSCYDEGKRAAETYLMDNFRQNNLDLKIIRIFNTYGPMMNPQDGRVVSNFINQALRNEPITIYGDGSQTRSFQYVDDLIDGMITLMNCENDNPGPFNIGNPSEYSMTDLAVLICKLTHSKSDIVYKDLPSDDPKQRKPDISKMKDFCGWEPKVSVENGLLATIEYYSQLI